MTQSYLLDLVIQKTKSVYWSKLSESRAFVKHWYALAGIVLVLFYLPITGYSQRDNRRYGTDEYGQSRRRENQRQEAKPYGRYDKRGDRREGLQDDLESQPFMGNSKYIGVTVGTGSLRFRDFATSPLFYSGQPIFVSPTLFSSSVKREITTGISVVHGNFVTTYNDHEATSSLQTLSIFHSRLYRFASLEKWNLKAGGELNFSGNLRQNPSLLNNAVGLEAFPVLYGSVKVTRDISRQHPRRNGKEPNHKSLSFRVNIGLLGGALRNNYSYTLIGPTLNKPALESIVGDRKFVGMTPLSTTLDYTIWLKNKNGWRFTYAWEAYKTREDMASLQLASHTLRVGILFNRKNN